MKSAAPLVVATAMSIFATGVSCGVAIFMYHHNRRHTRHLGEVAGQLNTISELIMSLPGGHVRRLRR